MKKEDFFECPSCGARFRVTLSPAQDTLSAVDRLLQSRGFLGDLLVEHDPRGITTVRTRHRLDKNYWKEIGDTLKTFGFRWVSDGERSRWERV